MVRINPKRSLVSLAVVAALLATEASAGAHGGGADFAATAVLSPKGSSRS
jgi:hypothetical protein